MKSSGSLPPPPSFLGEKAAASAAAPDAAAAADFVSHHFSDGSQLHAMRTQVRLLDAAKSQFLPVAQMCVATYCYLWLDAQREIEEFEAAGGAEDQLRERRDAARLGMRKWVLLLRILDEFWLARQRAPLSAELQLVADVVSADALSEPAALRHYLRDYLRRRGLADDAAPRLGLHAMVFGEYFSIHHWQLGNSPAFDRALCVVAGDSEAPVVVGQVLLGSYGDGADGDGVAVMQGAISCPFYAQRVHEQRMSAAPSRLVGIGDSLLLHLWEAHHSPSPPFRAMRVQPLSHAPSWRARVLRLPFVLDWHGRPYSDRDPTVAEKA